MTGFGPFGTVTDNPSGHLAEGCGRPHEVLEVSYEAADRFVRELDPDRFDVLLMLGVAARRKKITPELYARNWRGEVPDVHGVTMPGPIEEGEPLLIESTLWTPHLMADLIVALNVETSMDAGNYLCNYLSYRALRRFTTKKVGFLHVPPFQEIPEERQAEVLAKILERIER